MITFLRSSFAINATAIFLGIVFFTAGMAKLFDNHAFPGLIGPVWLEDQLAPHGLALYARFIAYSQVFIGFTLMTLRFRTIGAIMSVPLILNILVVTISLNWQGTPFVLAFLLATNIYLLLIDMKILLPLIGVSTHTDNKSLSARGNIVWLAGLMLVFSSITLSFVSLTFAWIIAASGIFISIYSNKVKNTQNISTS